MSSTSSGAGPLLPPLPSLFPEGDELEPLLPLLPSLFSEEGDRLESVLSSSLAVHDARLITRAVALRKRFELLIECCVSPYIDRALDGFDLDRGAEGFKSNVIAFNRR